MSYIELNVKSNTEGWPDVSMKLFARQVRKETLEYISSLKRDDAIVFCKNNGWKLIEK